jgi:hypothetical protein
METTHTTQQEHITVTKTITTHQVQDLYDILNHREVQDKYACVKDILYSLLGHSDQEYHIIIKKLGHRDPLYYLSINNIYDEEDINQEQAIALHDLLQ